MSLARISDASSLQSAIEMATTTGQFASNPTQRRHIMRRARDLGRFDLIPDAWKHINREPAVTKTRFDDHERSEANEALAIKADQHNVDLSLLQTVYVRGVREFAQLQTPPTEVTTRHEWALARVNSFLRAHNGDPATRDADHDLLNP